MIRLPRYLSFKNDYFVFLLPLFFIMNGFMRYPVSIPLSDTVVLYLKYVIFTLFLGMTMSFLFKSLRKAFLFIFIVLCFDLFFGSIHDWMKENFGHVFFVKYIFLLPLILILFAGSVYLLKKSNRDFNGLIKYLNVLFVLLILSDLARFGFASFRKEQEILKLTPCPSCPNPDIYLLITDGYGGKRQLTNRFNFDNSPFEHVLAKKGFKIIDSSISNYSATNKSIASLFNMNYICNVDKEDYHSYTNTNTLVNFLKEQEYEIKNLSFFKVANQSPYVSIEYFPTGISLITNHTLLGRLNRDVRHNLATTLGINAEKKRILETVQKEKKYLLERDDKVMKGLIDAALQKSGKPRFIYAHFTMPHGPFLFDSKGKPLNTEGPEEQNYIEYLQYTNSKLSHAIESILRFNPSAVVLLLSDHGYRKDSQLPLSSDRFINLNAVYFPGQNYQSFYKGMSNVNYFRIVLNTLFKQQIPLTKDSTVY